VVLRVIRNHLFRTPVVWDWRFRYCDEASKFSGWNLNFNRFKFDFKSLLLQIVAPESTGSNSFNLGLQWNQPPSLYVTFFHGNFLKPWHHLGMTPLLVNHTVWFAKNSPKIRSYFVPKMFQGACIFGTFSVRIMIVFWVYFFVNPAGIYIVYLSIFLSFCLYIYISYDCQVFSFFYHFKNFYLIKWQFFLPIGKVTSRIDWHSFQNEIFLSIPHFISISRITPFDGILLKYDSLEHSVLCLIKL
jgi:hypothetical protein